MSSTAAMPCGPLHLFFSKLLSSSNSSNHGSFKMDNVPPLVLVEDNAKGHGGCPAQDVQVPFTAMRRASSTGSLGIDLKSRKSRSKKRKTDQPGCCRWDTGTQSLELLAAPSKILLDPHQDDIEEIQWMISTRDTAQAMTCTNQNATGPLARSGSTFSLDEGMYESDASGSRWTTGSSRTPAIKKDGAAKLPRRKFSALEESKISSPCTSPVQIRSLSPIRLPVSVRDHPSSTNKHNYQDLLTALEEVDSEVNFFLPSKHLEIAPELFRTI